MPQISKPKPHPVELTEEAMDVDAPKISRARPDRKRVDKRVQKRSGIVFQKYSDRATSRKTTKAKK